MSPAAGGTGGQEEEQCDPGAERMVPRSLRADRGRGERRNGHRPWRVRRCWWRPALWGVSAQVAGGRRLGDWDSVSYSGVTIASVPLGFSFFLLSCRLLGWWGPVQPGSQSQSQESLLHWRSLGGRVTGMTGGARICLLDLLLGSPEQPLLCPDSEKFRCQTVLPGGECHCSRSACPPPPLPSLESGAPRQTPDQASPWLPEARLSS